jgi:GTPase SAR1 family protein
MYDCYKKLQNSNESQFHGKVDILLIYGPEESGKSCFVKKFIAYMIERTRKSGSSSAQPQLTYLKWIYLDLKRYETLLQFKTECSIVRSKVVKNTLPEVVEWARKQKCFIVLDHCHKLAELYKHEFKDMVDY